MIKKVILTKKVEGLLILRFVQDDYFFSYSNEYI